MYDAADVHKVPDLCVQDAEKVDVFSPELRSLQRESDQFETRRMANIPPL